jgi:hypothetical protein
MNCEAVGMCLQAETVMNAEIRISSLSEGTLRSCRRITLGTYHGASAIMSRALDWKCSRISILEVEADPQSCMRWSR